ncbi:MAG: formylglycine-generating enzyme family protein [Kiritimatiellia bacterium]|jgi:formylglycine-generating enzyme required for sulfatase activity|nr:formylglycine-generating enzyme family protein [Kiritimatiellia bacterium]
MKYTTTVLIALVALVSTPTVRAAPPETKHIVSMQARQFALPDAIEMVKIPAGTFTMGSPKGEVGRGEDEAQRTVMISKPFYMAKQEIKQTQYVPMMRPNYDPIFFRKGAWGFSLPEIHQHGPYTPGKPETHLRRLTDKPMEGVSWKYAVEFCEKLTAREKAAGRLPNGYEYRLPTEAEWEYACRAGTTGAFNAEQVEKTVDAIGTRQAEIIAGKAKGSDAIQNEGGVANTFGLMDMHMGMLEWVLDDYAPYQGSETTDPVAFTDGRSKVIRGGFDNFYEDPSPKGKVYSKPNEWRRYVRSASRGHLMPGMPYPYVGLRPVLAPAITVPQPAIPDEYNIGVLKAEDTALRESDLAAFKKAMEKK